jgi:hypothetical protein
MTLLVVAPTEGGVAVMPPAHRILPPWPVCPLLWLLHRPAHRPWRQQRPTPRLCLPVHLSLAMPPLRAPARSLPLRASLLLRRPPQSQRRRCWRGGRHLRSTTTSSPPPPRCPCGRRRGLPSPPPLPPRRQPGRTVALLLIRLPPHFPQLQPQQVEAALFDWRRIIIRRMLRPRCPPRRSWVLLFGLRTLTVLKQHPHRPPRPPPARLQWGLGLWGGLLGLRV